VERLQHLGFLLEDTARLYARRLRKYSRVLPLPPSQCRALLTVAGNAGISQTGLARLCGLNSAQTTRLVDLLEREGWVERSPHPRDRRAHLLTLTAKAAQVLRRVSGIVGEADSQAQQHLSAEEVGTLLRLLERVRANLTASPLDPIQSMRARQVQPAAASQFATSRPR
jgi:MarR family transcriptional regulator, transcriptional regulator for hemolysin